MSDEHSHVDDTRSAGQGHGHAAPGEQEADAKANVGKAVGIYATGLLLAGILTAASFWAAGSHAIFGPAVPAALIALAVAQMGVHLVFFLHITTGPDNTNNVLALAFGVLIVALVLVGSLWIMRHLDHNLMPMSSVMDMQR
ncbi:cytochrome o ubiquinol oxidase subunit IV [Sphingomonas abaci]|uniref:Cytochrome bo(3) ubiquinol oxidase subunit 4 n=1 Tax=Sphingomonas abaci TaxID=237611 RepID=A0A7W7AL53_9SPHN|nr:cytochrome o ubiquinol oxidase subunit IV [Sphingomonas abaci]MBB4619078.1 cytochrome o ubiquinol oxidase operon protein cyoD [Sphingomonas abaci]